MNIFCNKPFSCQFWLGDITQIIKNWKHWLRVQNLPVRQSFERAKKVCVLGYMASSCTALSNFTTICIQKLTSWGHPKWMSLKCHYLLLLFWHYSYLWMLNNYSQNYSGIMFAGLPQCLGESGGKPSGKFWNLSLQNGYFEAFWEKNEVIKITHCNFEMNQREKKLV